MHRFGPFEFVTDSGELRRADRPQAEPQRLSPQPARLLALLLEHRGQLVERETIRRRLWPDVHVDFDSNLHFCVRQIRAALGESADEPRYIETLPRRGYRLVAEPAPAAPASRFTFRFGPMHALVLILVLTTLAWFAGVFEPREPPPAASAAEAPVRIGILPFRHVGPDGSALGEGIAEAILEGLMRGGGPGLELIGPTTTGGYDDTPDSLTRLAAEHRLDFVLHGRWVGEGPTPELLAELIRLPDGAHVWVERYTDLDDPRGIARDITDGVTGWLAE